MFNKANLSWLRDSSNMNIKNIAIASVTIYFYWGTLMFWLYYGINKNNSTAQHYSDGHSHRYEQVSKDRWKPELPPSISPEQLFPTPVPDRADKGPWSGSHLPLSIPHSTTATEPWPWESWVKKPQHKPKKLKLKQGVNAHWKKWRNN